MHGRWSAITLASLDVCSSSRKNRRSILGVRVGSLLLGCRRGSVPLSMFRGVGRLRCLRLSWCSLRSLSLVPNYSIPGCGFGSVDQRRNQRRLGVFSITPFKTKLSPRKANGIQSKKLTRRQVRPWLSRLVLRAGTSRASHRRGCIL